MNLMQHQIKAVEFLSKNNGTGALFHEVGCGKTISGLATYLYLKTKTPELKLIVICPLSLIEGAWIKEIEKFAPNMRWYNLHSGRSNLHISNNFPINQTHHMCNIWIINFEYMISQSKFDDLKKQIERHEWMCIIDESSKMKNHDAKTTERIIELSSLFKYRIIMSGTPAPNIEWEYWAQMKFLNPNIFPGNFYKFKNTYFELKRGNQIQPGTYMGKTALREMFKQGFKYAIKPKMKKEMLERMKPWCDVVSARDCMDLPEEVDEFRIIEMDTTQRNAYEEMKKFCVLELKEAESFAVANIILTKFMKLRQITSGFVIDEYKNCVPVVKKNPKMEALKEIIEECGNEQIIIWAQFHGEIKSLVDILKQYGGVSMLYGEIPPSDRINHINNFIRGNNRFLIAHPDSAAHGLTFVNCHIQIFFSLSYSYEEYSQARGRTMRYGQKNNCVYFHILAKDSIDEDVLKIVQRKASAQDIADKYLKG